MKQKSSDILYEVGKIMSKQLENAKNLYIRGIEDGKIKEVHENYMGETYTQHSTGVPDGKEGFAEFFKDFFKRYPKRKMHIVRAIEDENFVFVHVHQYLNDGQAQWITADIFKSDDKGRIIEHWDVIEEYPKEIKGLDPIYGNFEVIGLEKTEDNKKLVRRFLVDILQNKEMGLFEHYVAENMIQHNQNIEQGRRAYQDYLLANDVSCDFVFKVMGQGNYVVAYSKMLVKGKAYAQFDIFRLEHGKIVEHWDNKEIIPNKEDLTNLGKF